MANRYRGELAATIDGREWTLCLTLGALAELEEEFGATDLTDLFERLGSARLGARQLLAIIAAGLRGGGHDVSDSEVAEMRFVGGIAGTASLVGDLLAAAFGSPAGRRDPVPASPGPTGPQAG